MPYRVVHDNILLLQTLRHIYHTCDQAKTDLVLFCAEMLEKRISGVDFREHDICKVQ